MAQIEFYTSPEALSPIAIVSDDGAVPRQGEFVNISRVTYVVDRVTWAVDRPSTGSAILRANVDLSPVKPTESEKAQNGS